jgi:hypothetical protein
VVQAAAGHNGRRYSSPVSVARAGARHVTGCDLAKPDPPGHADDHADDHAGADLAGQSDAPGPYATPDDVTLRRGDAGSLGHPLAVTGRTLRLRLR